MYIEFRLCSRLNTAFFVGFFIIFSNFQQISTVLFIFGVLYKTNHPGL